MYYKLGVADFYGNRDESRVRSEAAFTSGTCDCQNFLKTLCFVCVCVELSNNCIEANSQRTHRVKGISYAKAAWYGALALKSLLSFTCS